MAQTVSGVTPGSPAGITTVAGWKAANFAPYKSSAARFPEVGAAIPSNPDASAVGVTPGQNFSLSLPTNEPYWVAFYGSTNKVLLHFLYNYQPPSYASPVFLAGQGNPTTLGIPAVPNGVYFDVSASDPGANLRMFVSRNGSWVATAA